MLKNALISVFITIVGALIVLLVVDNRYIKKEIYQFTGTAVTVDDIRINAGLYMGDTVSVIGVLYPLPYEGVANDAVLLPNKDFLEFNEGLLDRYFLRLDNIFKPDGVALKDECFEEYVSVNGTVGAFGGLPFINTDLVYRLSGGQELNCLERE